MTLEESSHGVDADEQTPDRPITDRLIQEDGLAGRFLALMLSGLFLYTIIAMGYCVYLTATWSQ